MTLINNNLPSSARRFTPPPQKKYLMPQDRRLAEEVQRIFLEVFKLNEPESTSLINFLQTAACYDPQSYYVPSRTTKLSRSIEVICNEQKEIDHVFVLFNKQSKNDRLIGQGATKTVKLAVDILSGRIYALLSFSYSKTDEKMKTAYMEEIALIKSIFSKKSPVRFCGHNTHASNKKFYFEKLHVYQELFDTDLSSLINKALLDFEEKRACAIQLLGQLSYLHRKKVVHRDIKPCNILVRTEDDKKHFYITDFGLSFKLEETPKRLLAGGSLNWIAPELLLSSKTVNEVYKNNTRFIDIWSMGLVLAYLFQAELGPINQSILYNFAQADTKFFWRNFPKEQKELFVTEAATSSIERIICEMCQINPLKRISSHRAHCEFQIHVPKKAPAFTKRRNSIT